MMLVIFLLVISIGITPVNPLLIIPVGPLLQKRSQFTTHVQPVGVFRMAEAMEFGQKHSVKAIIGKPHPIGIPRTKEWTFQKQTRN